jgi:hypothetical protein
VLFLYPLAGFGTNNQCRYGIDQLPSGKGWAAVDIFGFSAGLSV